MSRWSRSNLGAADRLVRVVLGIVALALVISGPRSAWGYLGIVLLGTAAIGFCPLYATFGISTRTRNAQ